MADSTPALQGYAAEKHRFTCGKQDFTISRDLDTGRWSHNRVGEDHYLRLASADRAQYQIVEIVCELLTKGIVKNAACAITDGKKLWRFYNGQLPLLARQGSPALLLAYLMFRERHPSWEGLTEKQADRMEFVGWFSEWRKEVDDTKWLRGVMGTTSYEHEDTGVEKVIQRRIANISAWEAGDLELWGEYAAWMMSVSPNQHLTCGRLSAALAKMISENVHSGRYQIGWDLLWSAGTGLNHSAVQVLHSVASEHFKSSEENHVEPQYLLPHNTINTGEILSDCAHIVVGGASAEVMALGWDHSPHDLPEKLTNALRVLAWKMAFSEIVSASKKAGCVSFGCEYPSLRALCGAKYREAVRHLFPLADPADLRLEGDAARFAQDVERLVFEDHSDKSTFYDHVKYDLHGLSQHCRPQKKQ